MNKLEWRKRTTSLRKLLHDLPGVEATGAVREGGYVHGALKHPDTKIWYVYNCLSCNIIGSVKFAGDTVVVRYRRRSWYAYILQSLKYPGKEMVYCASDNLSVRRSWARTGLQTALYAYYVSKRVRNARRLADTVTYINATDTLSVDDVRRATTTLRALRQGEHRRYQETMDVERAEAYRRASIQLPNLG